MSAVLEKVKMAAPWKNLLCSVFLVAAIYLSELFHLLEEPLFSLYYFGNGNAALFGVTAGAYIFLLFLLLRKQLQAFTGTAVFGRQEPLSLGRKAALYVMTVGPVLLVAVFLNFRFKLVIELGQRITFMSAVGNAAGFFLKAAKIFGAIYCIALAEDAVRVWAGRPVDFPIGGLFAMLCFGLLEWLFVPSRFSPLYLLLYFYFGVLYKVAKGRFGVTFVLALVLYIL